MAKLYVFADEAGDFAFKRAPNVSRFFIVCTISMPSCEIAHDLLSLRRQLSWEKAPLGEYFHASTDAQKVRDRVFALIRRYEFSVQATIMEKVKAMPKVRPTRERFYQYGWYYHFLYGMQPLITANTELHITAASVGTKKGQVAFTDGVNDVLRQTIQRKQWVAAFWPCGTDPCLQVADYCTWAIQRKWERGDLRSHALIQDRITYEYDLWSRGTVEYY